MIRRMETDDIEAVVKIHLASFPGFFLTFMGYRFLFIFYSGVCTATEAVALVYLDRAGAVAGFVAGTSNPRGFYSRLLRRDWLKFAIASIIPVMKKPSVISRVIRAVSHPADNPVGDDVAGLFSIGVLPELQGNGAGKELVRAFLDEAKQRGCKRVFLTTDRDNNAAVNVFYEKLGFSIDRYYVTPEGRKMNEYCLTLSEEIK